MLEEVQGERNSDGERVTVYRHMDTSVVFTKIAGGLAWPAIREGFLAVVGEKAQHPRAGGRRPLILMHEAHAESMVALAKECAALERLYFVNDWHTNVQGENGGYADRFYDLIREHKGRSCAYQTNLPENFGLALQVLRQKFLENGLLLLKDGILAKRLTAINHEDPGQKDLHEKYPEILVLAACVYELDSNPAEEEEDPDEWRNGLQYQHDGRSRIGGY